MNSKKGKASRAVFLSVCLLLQCLGPSPHVSQLASHYRAAVTDRRGPPIEVIFPQSPLLRARVPSPTEFPSSSQPHVECSHHLNAHLSTCRREPSHCLLVSFSVASMLHAALLPPAVAPVEMLTQGARQRRLAQPAPLVELTRPKARCLGPCVTLPARA
jgi:hypothetical protein